MSRIDSTFAGADGARRPALVPLVTCGDPGCDVTVEVVCAAAAAGADAVVLGIPFSDPTVEGPVVRASSVRALEAGATAGSALEVVRRVRARSEVPVLLGSYANVVLSYGIERFAADAAAAGADALVLQDVPFEERDEFAAAMEGAGIELVRQVSPAAPARVAEVSRGARGLVWCAAELGSAVEAGALASVVADARAASGRPVLVEAGVSTPEEAAEVVRVADGVVVPAAVDALLGEYGANAAASVAELVGAMAEAVHAA